MPSKHDHGSCLNRLGELLELLEVGGYEVVRAWIDSRVGDRTCRHYWNSRFSKHVDIPSNATRERGEPLAEAQVQVLVPGAVDRSYLEAVEVAAHQVAFTFVCAAPDAHADSRRAESLEERRKRLWGGRHPGN